MLSTMFILGVLGQDTFPRSNTPMLNQSRPRFAGSQNPEGIALFGEAMAMTTGQRKVTIGFSVAIALAMAWGLGTYARYWYQDLSLPAGSLDGAAFIEGRPVLFLATASSVLLGICFRICYFQLGKASGDA